MSPRKMCVAYALTLTIPGSYMGFNDTSAGEILFKDPGSLAYCGADRCVGV